MRTLMTLTIATCAVALGCKAALGTIIVNSLFILIVLGVWYVLNYTFSADERRSTWKQSYRSSHSNR